MAALDYKREYCHDCKRYVLAQRKGTNHVLHLLLSVITVGLWVIIWILLCIPIDGWYCPNCGGEDLEDLEDVEE